MRGFDVGAGRCFESDTAHLASVVVENFDPPRLRCVPDDSRYRRLSAFGGKIGIGSLRNRLTRYDSFWDLSEPKAPNQKA